MKLTRRQYEAVFAAVHARILELAERSYFSGEHCDFGHCVHVAKHLGRMNGVIDAIVDQVTTEREAA